jgi:dihydrofolate synthase/folylpolyglutamate synthase
MENAAVAISAMELLAENGAAITASQIINGLAKVCWPGRLQVLRREPLVVIDSAHNTYSMKKLGEALKKYFTFSRLFLVLGFSGDKDISGMANEAVEMTSDIIIAPSRHPRSVKPETLVAEFAKRGVRPRTADSVAAAMKMALTDAGPNDLVCATGSVFVVAEALEEYMTAAGTEGEHGA